MKKVIGIALILVEALCAVESTPAKKFCQGDDFLQAPPAYNAPAGVLLRNPTAGRADLFVDASFLYYYASQDGMNLATSAQLYNAINATPWLNIETSNGTMLSQDFAYKPAFQIGLGTNVSEWMIAAYYTWVRQTTHTKSSAPSPEPTVSGIGSWVVNNWVEQYTSAGRVNSGPSLTSEWKLGLDLIDLVAGRPYYEGKNLTLSPFFGLRGALIRQHLNLDLTVSSLVTTFANPENTIIYSKTYSNSWGIGPIGGVEATCLLGSGFRLEASTNIASLYTTYTTLKHSENVVSIAPYSSEIGIQENHTLHLMRPELEMSLGLAWGSYFSDQRFHVDLYAGYDFNLFWQQNMIRALMDETAVGIGSSPGNLYLQGLNIRASFNF